MIYNPEYSLIAAALGAVAGLHAACYGAYKDSPYEKFLPVRFWREVLLAILAGVLLFIWRPTSVMSVFFLSTLAASRILTEWYKQFVRVESQAIYKIPSMVHIFRTVPTSSIVRLTIGAGLFIAIALAGQLATFIVSVSAFPWHGILVGLTTGILTAFGGGYKDGFFEGFDPKKFFRSPVVGALSGLLLGGLTTDPWYLLLSCIGLERMIVECYKGFYKRGYVPGKFKFTKANYPKYFAFRKRLILPYIASWVVMLTILTYDIVTLW